MELAGRTRVAAAKAEQVSGETGTFRIDFCGDVMKSTRHDDCAPQTNGHG